MTSCPRSTAWMKCSSSRMPRAHCRTVDRRSHVGQAGAKYLSSAKVSSQTISSITYHEWTLIGVWNYWLYTNDVAWVQSVWTKYTLAVQYLASKVDATTGLIDSTGASDDWGRSGGAGFSISPNVLYYRVRVLPKSRRRTLQY
jgi:hypothetical protein